MNVTSHTYHTNMTWQETSGHIISPYITQNQDFNLPSVKITQNQDFNLYFPFIEKKVAIYKKIVHTFHLRMGSPATPRSRRGVQLLLHCEPQYGDRTVGIEMLNWMVDA